MIRFDEERDGGRWQGVAGSARIVGEILTYADAVRRHPTATSRELEFAGTPTWFKGESFAGNSGTRHRWRKRLGRPYPRIAEYENLEWLRAHRFGAPEPLVAATWLVRGLPTWQFLATRRETRVQSLETYLREPLEGRGELLLELAESVARMHSLGFVHRDLFPRNLLVREQRSRPRLVFLDAWRGGARRQSRGPSYDLACLFLQLPDWLERAEEESWFRHYLEARCAAGESLRHESFLRSLERARRAWVRRLDREPGRLRGGLPPAGNWSAPRV